MRCAKFPWLTDSVEMFCDTARILRINSEPEFTRQRNDTISGVVSMLVMVVGIHYWTVRVTNAKMVSSSFFMASLIL